MKPGTKITGSRLPTCNGRPQLWYSDGISDKYTNRIIDRMRIIQPNGHVTWSPEASVGRPIDWLDPRGYWMEEGCTSGADQECAQHNVLRYDRLVLQFDTYFMGYL